MMKLLVISLIGRACALAPIVRSAPVIERRQTLAAFGGVAAAAVASVTRL